MRPENDGLKCERGLREVQTFRKAGLSKGRHVDKLAFEKAGIVASRQYSPQDHSSGYASDIRKAGLSTSRPLQKGKLGLLKAGSSLAHEPAFERLACRQAGLFNCQLSGQLAASSSTSKLALRKGQFVDKPCCQPSLQAGLSTSKLPFHKASSTSRPFKRL